MNRYFLVDCNNFFVSCERVFNPAIHNKPVAVLSSNDACIIARSNEVKALGVPMGAPLYQYEKLLQKHHVALYSANFALYGDMSQRIMRILTECSTDIEPYSIDEAFLHVPNYIPNHGNEDAYYMAYAHHIRLRVKQETGVPVSIGIGPTKTLAKIANDKAKKDPNLYGVCDITNHKNIDSYLTTIPVKEIWGIGHRYAKLLNQHNIQTAYDFKYADDVWVRKRLTITGLKTLHEIRGISCISLSLCSESKQSISVSRSFGNRVSSIEQAKQALAAYVTCAAEKLRKQKSVAAHLTAYIITNRYQDPNNYYQAAHIHLPTATNYTPDLIAASNACLEKIFQKGLLYKKVGVILTDFTPHDCLQMSTTTLENIHSKQQYQFIQTVDSVNRKYGRKTLFFAAEGTSQPWKNRQDKKTSCFTTNWHEILTITI